MGMKWAKFILIPLAALLVLAVVLPFFVSLDHYVPAIEKAAADRLHEPVSIKSIRLSLLPTPHVVIEGLSVGTTADVSVGKVRVAPAIFSLLSETKVVRRIDIDDLVLTQKGIDKIPVWTQPSAPGAAGPQVRIESIRLGNALVKMDRASFGPFDARVNLNASGEPEDASITTRDGKLKIVVTPGPSNYLLDIAAKSWTLPGPAITFDELTIKGSATLNDASFDQIGGKLYGGSIAGKATFGWRKRIQLSGNLDIDQVEVKQIAAAFSPKTHVSGKLIAKPVFSATAGDAAQLMDALRVDTAFSLHDGVLHGVDIQKAATSLVKREPAGGETRFDQLSGNLSMEHNAFRFTQLKIGSGALAVDGDVNISAKKELSGRITAQVKALGTSTGVPLNVAGTLDLPLLYPTGATLTGAAVGTMLMGPGVGTAVGVKAGNFVEGLFGKKDDQKAKK
jgi:uncharacterized protein involved in outer membrane biogenesis